MFETCSSVDEKVEVLSLIYLLFNKYSWISNIKLDKLFQFKVSKNYKILYYLYLLNSLKHRN